jgi:Flp pilus assembly protein TadD
MQRNINKIKHNNPVSWIVIIALIFIVSGCSSTGGERKQVSRATNQNCTPTKKVDSQNLQDSQQNNQQQGGCGPAGVIQISENYGVDPEIRKEFDEAVVLLNQSEYAEAIKLLKAVSGKTSKFSAPYINLGIAYVRTDELGKAEESFKKALEINNQHPVAHNELGLVYRKTGRYAEARQLYESLLVMYPDFMPARKNLGVLCDIYLQDLTCALEQYEKYLSDMPDDEKVKIWVADVNSRM